MKLKRYTKLMLTSVGLVLGTQSCKLDSKVYDQIKPENFFQSADQITAFTSSGYANVSGYFGTMVLEVGVTSDELANPLRSNDGWPTNDDQMAHDFKASEGYISNAWNTAFGGVGTCNRLIEFLQDLKTDQTAAISELRALRAFYLWFALDLFGKIPVELRFANADPAPKQVSPAEAYAVIEKELLESIPTLNPNKSQSTYAKMNQSSAYMVLANLYINAERYGVGTKWNEAANAAQKVINSGNYGLSPGYFSNFMIKNESSVENIFVIPFDRNQIVNNIVHQSLHQSAGATFGLAAQPWGGYSVKSDFYNSFDTSDYRRGMFIVGQQYTKRPALSGMQRLDSGIPILRIFLNCSIVGKIIMFYPIQSVSFGVCQYWLMVRP